MNDMWADSSTRRFDLQARRHDILICIVFGMLFSELSPRKPKCEHVSRVGTIVLNCFLAAAERPAICHGQGMRAQHIRSPWPFRLLRATRIRHHI